jgi:APA family basic amino acid/polyamine antiporter
MNTTDSNNQLVRGLGLAAAISIVVGTVIGTGIFLKARVMMCNVESPGWMIFAWVAAGLLSLAGALTYSELAAMMPKAGGEYVFMREAYGKAPAFLYGWTQFAVAYTGSMAAKGIGFAIFLNALVGNSLTQVFFKLNVPFLGEVPFGTVQVIALVMMVLVTLLNCLHVSIGGQVSVVLTGIKIVIVLVFGLAVFILADGTFGNFSLAGTGGGCEGVDASARASIGGFAPGMAAAMLGALWAYDGWTNVAILAGEVKNPQKNLPRALIGGMLIVIALYLLANLAYVYALDPQAIASVPKDSSVAVEVGKLFLGKAAISLMSMTLLISTLGSFHTGTMSGARISYAMAHDGLFFKSLARISPKTRVPVNALILQCVWACVLVLSGSYDKLTDYVIFAAWIFYALNTASVFYFRWKLPDAERPYRTLGYPVVPALFLMVALWLLFNTVLANPTQSLTGLVIIALGLPIYYYWASRQSAES